MLPKKLRAKQVTDFRPIANLRLLYKVFAYLLLGRLEHVLDAQQPEEQHGFRAGRRLEEHLLSANLLLDKAEASGFPVWIISLDLSKAFDRAHWPALWAALFEQGVSEHLIWILQRVYYGQHGEIVGDSRSQAVCDKAAFSVHGYFVLFWNLPCENGGMPLDKLALI